MSRNGRIKEDFHLHLMFATSRDDFHRKAQSPSKPKHLVSLCISVSANGSECDEDGYLQKVKSVCRVSYAFLESVQLSDGPSLD